MKTMQIALLSAALLALSLTVVDSASLKGCVVDRQSCKSNNDCCSKTCRLGSCVSVFYFTAVLVGCLCRACEFAFEEENKETTTQGEMVTEAEEKPESEQIDKVEDSDRMFPTCETTKCAEDEYCKKGNINCFVAPCPAYIPQCVKKDDKQFPTCETITCAEDEYCTKVTINCLLPPCPDYSPECVKKEATKVKRELIKEIPDPCKHISCTLGRCAVIDGEPECVLPEPYQTTSSI